MGLLTRLFRRPSATPTRSLAHIKAASTRKANQRAQILAKAETLRSAPAVRERLGL